MNKNTVIIFMIFIILWQIIVGYNLVSSFFFSSPFEILISFQNLFTTDSISQDILATFTRTFFAFIISAGIGTPLGIFVGYVKNIGANAETLLDFLRSIPPIALFPLFLFFFGIGDMSKIAVAVFAGTMIITIAAMYGAKQINRTRLNLVRKMGLKGKELFIKVLLPESLINTFGGYRVAASLCLILVIVTEMFLGGAKHGLGKRLIDAQMLYNIPDLYSLIIISGIIGYLLNKSFVIFESRIIHWRGH